MIHESDLTPNFATAADTIADWSLFDINNVQKGEEMALDSEIVLQIHVAVSIFGKAD